MKAGPVIIFQCDTLLAVAKPAGLLSVPDRHQHDLPSLSAWVTRQWPDARPLHRLDLFTSGVMLFCLQPEAFGYYSDQFTNREITKHYLALVEGRVMPETGTVDQPLWAQSGGKVIVSKRGKASQTRFEVIEYFTHFTWISLEPLTGRTHQLRVHMAHIGHPMVGDTVYGGSPGLFLSRIKGKRRYKTGNSLEEERPLIGRTALHAASISLHILPDHTPVSITCPLPKDLSVGLAKLHQYDGGRQT